MNIYGIRLEFDNPCDQKVMFSNPNHYVNFQTDIRYKSVDAKGELV